MFWWNYTETIVVIIIVLSGPTTFGNSSQNNWQGTASETVLDRAENCMAKQSTGHADERQHDACQVSHDPSHQNVTVVTALFDIGRENWPYFQRKYDDYLSYGRQLLSMNINLVIFIDQKGQKFVEENRRGKEAKTVIQVMKKEDLPYAKLYLKKAKTIMGSSQFKTNHQLLKHPEGFSPWYNIMINSKLSLLYKAILLDPFNSTFYSWLDFGYAHGNEVYPASRVWAPRNIMMTSSVDKITYIQLHDNKPTHINNVFKKRGLPFLNGGFFAGSKKAMLVYNDLFNKVFQQCIEEGIIDDDQSLSFACYHKQPSLFNLVRGDWYDLFKLFH